MCVWNSQAINYRAGVTKHEISPGVFVVRANKLGAWVLSTEEVINKDYGSKYDA